MNIQADTFQTGQIASAIGVSPQTIKTWLHNGVVMGQRDITGGGGAGNRRNFSFENVMEFAAANALMKVAFQRDTEAAFKAAAKFAHSGVGPTNANESERHPGLPFSDGRTLLCATKEHATVVQHIAGQDVMATIRNNLRGATEFAVVDIGDVFDLVVSALGYHPQEQIDLAYKKAD